MKLAWLSDIHLVFLKPPAVEAFIGNLIEEPVDGLLITGDISDAPHLLHHLRLFADLNVPIYFLLGNHDFYHGNFAGVQSAVDEFCARHRQLVHLGSGEIIRLSETTVLVGHRGWGDGRAGLAARSTVSLNDQRLIEDFIGLDEVETFHLLNKLGDDSAAYLRELLPRALATAQSVIVATHVPPFLECALYHNVPCNPEYAPHFVNVAFGHALLEVAKAHPEKNISVFCGHSHHSASFEALPNLTVKVAGAEYRRPAIAEVITV